MRLLDVNVLIALADTGHEHHRAATTWFAPRAARGWATCPLTENALLRILGAPGYPRPLGSPAKIREALIQMRSATGHQFIADSASFADTQRFPTLVSATSKQLTDIYLLGLAAAHGLKFSTFDARIPTRSVRQGDKTLELIPTA